MKRLRKSKLIALTLILIMFLNMFSPFKNIFISEVKGTQEGVPNPAVILRRSTDIKTKGSNKYFEMEVALVDDISSTGFELQFSYDKTKIEPANKKTKAKATTIRAALTQQSEYTTSFQESSTYLDINNATIDLMPFSGTPYNPMTENTEIDGIDTHGYNAYMLIYTICFRLVDTTLTEEDLTTDLFQVYPKIDSLKTGFTIEYENENGILIARDDVDLLGFDNFVEGKNASVKNVTIKTLPNKVNYIHNEEINLTGGELAVELKDGSRKTVSMIDPEVTLVSSKNADKTKQEVQITYYGRQIKFTIYVSDPTESLSFIKQPTNLSYAYQENIKPDGAIIKVVKKSGELKAITLPDSSVTMIGNVVADLSDSGNSTVLGTGADGNPAGIQTVTLEYDGIQLKYTIIVNQAIQSIKMGTLPKTTYNYGESLALENGTIIVTTDNGDTTIPLTDSSIKITELDGSTYNSKELGTRDVLVDYMGQTTKFSVTINDYVEKLIVNGPTKKEYNAGEELDLAGTEIIPVTASGIEQSAIPVTENMLTTTFNPNTLGIQVMKVTYNGLEGKFNVTVNDIPESIKVTAPTNFVSIFGQDLDLSNVEFTINMISGSVIKGGNVNQSMISGFNKNQLGIQTVTVTYQGKTDTFDVEVIEAVSSIAVKTTPKTTYKYGENLNVENGVIEVTYTSGRTEEIPMTTNMVSGYNRKQLNGQTLTVTYAGKTATYAVNVEDYVKELQITPPTSSKVIKGQNLDLTGAKVKEIMASGAPTTEIDVTESMLQTPFDNTKLGKQTLVVKYNGKTASFDVTVTNEIVQMLLDTSEGKTIYKVGEPLDVSKIKLDVTRENGDVEQIILPDSKVTVTGFDSSLPTNSQTLTVTYEGKTVTYNVEIKDYVKDFEVTIPKTTYIKGEPFSLDGSYIVEKLASGNTGNTIPLNDSKITVSNFDTTKVGKQTITITYEGIQKTVDLMVTNNAVSMTLDYTNGKLTYKYGEPLDISNLTLNVTYEDGTTGLVAVTESMVTGFNSNVVTNAQTLTVTLNGLTQTYQIKIIDYVKEIKVTKPKKETYKIGESNDLTDGYLVEKYASGKVSSPIKLDESNVVIKGFDTKTEGTKTITVEYTVDGKKLKDTYQILVIDKLQEVNLVSLPEKLEYKYGEPLNLKGGQIEFKKESGNTEKLALTDSKVKVTGYDAKKLGKQQLTVTYEGLEKTFKFDVEVKDYVTGITITNPTKTTYKYGEDLSLTGATVSEVMASGAVKNTTAITGSMISKFDSKKPGKQTITVSYAEFTKQFTVTVEEEVKPTEPTTPTTPVKPNEPATKPNESRPTSPTESTTGNQVASKPSSDSTQSPINSVENNDEVEKEEASVELPENKEQEQQPVQKPQEEKPTETLGVKDEKETAKSNRQIVSIIGIIGSIILLILIFFRRNVKVYVEEDGEFVLGGLDKINKKHLELDIDKYIDGETYQNTVRIRLSESISEKLDGKEIEIKHRGQKIKYKITYDDKPYEIILK